MNHNDLRKYMERLKATDPDGHSWVQSRARQAVDSGTKAKTVVDHPGWQMFVDKITEYADAATRSRDLEVEELTQGADTADDLKHRLRIKELNGALAAYASVLAVVPTLIRDAAKAAEQL